MKHKLFIFILFFLTITVSQAETIYTKTDNQGNVIYSDMPIDNAKKMLIPEGNSTKSLPATGATETKSSGIEAATHTYTTFEIASPSHEEMFQNTREIPIKLTVVPKLQEGDTVQLYIDGQPYGPLAATDQFTTKQLDRGAHTVSAAVVDKHGTPIKMTNAITFYVQYARLGTKI